MFIQAILKKPRFVGRTKAWRLWPQANAGVENLGSNPNVNSPTVTSSTVNSTNMTVEVNSSYDVNQSI